MMEWIGAKQERRGSVLCAIFGPPEYGWCGRALCCRYTRGCAGEHEHVFARTPVHEIYRTEGRRADLETEPVDRRDLIVAR